jgi:signal transduction histidine kinase
MKKSLHHYREKERLEALKSYQLLDTLPEKVFDDLSFLASQICEAPSALINLIDYERYWPKANFNLDITQGSRVDAFCSHTILEKDMLEIADLRLDERFKNSPFVLPADGVRFYAGAILNSPEGLPLGTICVLDHRPRELTEKQRQGLLALARLVVNQFEIRKTNLGLQNLVLKFDESTSEKDDRIKALGQFSQGLAHELNNPLAIMTGYLQVMEHKNSLKESTEREIDRLQQVVKRVASVVEDVRRFSQTRTLPNTETLQLNDVLEDVRLTIEARTLGHHEDVKIQWPTGIEGNLQGEHVQLVHGIEHIVMNAIQAANKVSEKWVRISCNEEQKNWVIRIQDSGEGMTDTDVKNIFQPFFTTKDVGQGQGLGLSVARGIFMAHGGGIQFTQNNPTTFEIRIPIQ